MKTNTLSKDEQLLKQYYSRYGGFWIYEGMLDYCYLVNPYFHRSRIIDEMQNNFRTLVSEYPSGMGVNSKLALSRSISFLAMVQQNLSRH